MNPSTQSTEFWCFKYDLARDEFAAGAISTDLFRGKLYRLGFRGQEIESEVRLHQPAQPGNT
jgi:hypothetical protein